MDWLYLLFLMCVYAAVPCIPAVLLRVKFPGTAYKWITVIAAVLGILCLFIIVIGSEELLERNAWTMIFAQCVLTSSVPALFCVVFCGVGRREIWLAAAPSLLYFLSFFLRHLSVYGFLETVNYFFSIAQPNSGSSEAAADALMMAAVMSVIFFIWAVLCIIISRSVYKVIASKKEEKKEKGRRYNKYR